MESQQNQIPNIQNNPRPLSDKRFKEIQYNPDNGLLYLINPTGEIFECNLYGYKQTKFIKDFTGFVDYKTRLKKSKIDPVNLKLNSTFYHPQGKYFEGYFQFPNPLSHPFQNINGDDSKLIEQLKKSKRMTLMKNKHLLKLKTNEGYHLFTSSVVVGEEKGKKKIIELIDSTVKDFEYNKTYGKPQEFQESQIKAIKRLKQIFLENSSNKIFKRILAKPNQKAYEDYYSVNRAMSVRPIEKIKQKNKKKVPSLSMDFIIKSKEEKYGNEKLCFCKNFI